MVFQHQPTPRGASPLAAPAQSGAGIEAVLTTIERKPRFIADGPPAPGCQQLRRNLGRGLLTTRSKAPQKRAAWPHHDPAAGRPDSATPCRQKIGLGAEGGRGRTAIQTATPALVGQPLGQGHAQTSGAGAQGRPAQEVGWESGACCCHQLQGQSHKAASVSWPRSAAGPPASSRSPAGARARPILLRGVLRRANAVARARQLLTSFATAKTNSTLWIPTRDC